MSTWQQGGFRVPHGAARSALAEIIVATAENPAAWTAVGGTVVAFLRRHRGKVHRFEIEGESVSIEGYSSKEAERLAAELAKSGRKRHDDPGPGVSLWFLSTQEFGQVCSVSRWVRSSRQVLRSCGLVRS